MKAFRRLALVALVLVSAVVVVASPAFATPRLTTSTGTRPDNGAVSPFISPIGDTLTRSLTITQRTVAGSRTGSSFTVRTAMVTDAITCVRLTASAEIPPTHTRIAIYSLDFLGCREDNLGAVVHVQTNHISSSNPFYIHITTDLGGNSGAGVFEIPAGSSISFWVLNAGVHVCEVVVQPQSVRGILVTTTARTIAVASGQTVDFSTPNVAGGALCPDARLRGRQDAVTALGYRPDDGTAYTVQTISRLP